MLRKRSAAKMNAPFKTTTKRGFLPSRSLLICVAMAFTRSAMVASLIDISNVLSFTTTVFIFSNKLGGICFICIFEQSTYEKF